MRIFFFTVKFKSGFLDVSFTFSNQENTGSSMEADWKETGSRLEADWKQTESRLKADLK